jgi:hypothetical protein
MQPVDEAGPQVLANHSRPAADSHVVAICGGQRAIEDFPHRRGDEVEGRPPGHLERWAGGCVRENEHRDVERRRGQHPLAAKARRTAGDGSVADVLGFRFPSAPDDGQPPRHQWGRGDDDDHARDSG